jgi:hypothetical protein
MGTCSRRALAAVLALATLGALPALCPCPQPTAGSAEHGCCLPESSTQLVATCCGDSSVATHQPATPEAPTLALVSATSHPLPSYEPEPLAAQATFTSTPFASPPLVLRI